MFVCLIDLILCVPVNSFFSDFKRLEQQVYFHSEPKISYVFHIYIHIQILTRNIVYKI